MTTYNNWYKLDNAAKIFPSVASNKDTKVFRFACELKENIDCELLQQALIKNIDDFPIYRSVLRRGVFWYYLDESSITPTVCEENLAPCYTIYTKKKKSLLFRVSYYKKRINLEVFHAITDGTGALEFLKGLVYQYLQLKYPTLIDSASFESDITSSVYDKMFDDFQKHYMPSEATKSKSSAKAYKIMGWKYPDYNIGIIEGCVSTKKALELAHKYNVTLTVVMVSILFLAISKNMRALQKKRDVVAAVPVNMRKYYPSETSRNFFVVVNIRYNFSQNSDNLEDIIKSVADSFKSEITLKNLTAKFNNLVKLEKNPIFRIVPLSIKDIVLKVVNNIILQKQTCGISSIGAITVPELLKPYIKGFDIFNSTNKLQLFICSYEDTLRFSFSSPYVDCNIQKDFFRTLVKLGLEVELTASPLEEV